MGTILGKSFSCFGLTIAIFGSPLFAQRRPVLPQIDLPHPYYYRELYLPQLTSGPSSVAWAPDSTLETWTDGMKRGRTFASNGPLIKLYP